MGLDPFETEARFGVSGILDYRKGAQDRFIGSIAVGGEAKAGRARLSPLALQFFAKACEASQLPVPDDGADGIDCENIDIERLARVYAGKAISRGERQIDEHGMSRIDIHPHQ